MIARVHHLHDERLCDCYYAERAGERADPPAAEHLADCAACGVRYAEMAAFLDGLRAEADAAGDEVFTPERLGTQQRQIAQRLEHVGCAARLLSFPKYFGGRHPDAAPPRVMKRWVAAAAAAGLFIGIGTGIFVESGRRAARPASGFGVAGPAPVAPTTDGVVSSPLDAADDQFLAELEMASDRPRTRELMPFDALTPHVREVVNQIR
jgi:anti-sigma factor RsiW